MLVAGLCFGFLLARPAASLLFPLRHASSLRHFALARELPPSLVAAIVHRESHFHARARSATGAQGLMQLMPDTARWTWTDLDGASEPLPDLENPDFNLQLGTRYLGYLRGLYGNHPATYRAAYNAGPQNVEKWLRSHRGETLEMERIPFPETRHYVASVLATRRVYQWLYPELDGCLGLEE